CIRYRARGRRWFADAGHRPDVHGGEPWAVFEAIRMSVSYVFCSLNISGFTGLRRDFCDTRFAQKKEDLMRKQFWILSLILVLGITLSAFAQENAAPGKTPKSTMLIFREDFKSDKIGEVQLTQDAITNPNVELKLYGPGSKPGNADQSGLLLS